MLVNLITRKGQILNDVGDINQAEVFDISFQDCDEPIQALASCRKYGQDFTLSIAIGNASVSPPMRRPRPISVMHAIPAANAVQKVAMLTGRKNNTAVNRPGEKRPPVRMNGVRCIRAQGSKGIRGRVASQAKVVQ